MARIENLEFLCNSYLSKGGNKETTNELYNKLLKWYFGEVSINTCAKRAYQDFKRLLKGISEMSEKDKNLYRNEVNELITSCVEKLFKNEMSFDIWHTNTCKQILDITEKHNLPIKIEFTYGLAQKWLNMTIKYMLIMEKWDNLLEPFKKDLHVPVDNYIMEGASSDLGIDIIDKNGELKVYNKDFSKAWSQWNESDYTRFQSEVRNATRAKDYDSSIDWEFDMWIKIKNKREG